MKEYKVEYWLNDYKSDVGITDRINKLVEDGWAFVKMQIANNYSDNGKPYSQIWLTFERDTPTEEQP